MQIEARDLTVALGATPILRGIDLSIRPGQLVGLIGPNGAGKTTLLRALANLLTPSAGTVLYDGQTARALGRGALARRIAFLVQGGGVHWQMRVETIVGLGRLPHRRPFAGDTAADRAAIERAMRATDVLAFRDRGIETLSGGERMRVLLARALAVEAPMLFADEPLAGLDPRHQLDAMALLQRIARSGAGVVVVLHDLTMAGRFCDRLVLLDRGRVLADGPADDVLSDAHLGRAFGIAVARGRRDDTPFILPWHSLPTLERPFP